MSAARIHALDALRGIAIFAMVVVNNPGSWQSIYAPLKHAAWHGLTPTDVIFPGFIFVMGLTIAIHLPRELAGRKSRKSVFINASRRALTLIMLGWLLYLFWFDTSNASFNWLEDRLLSLRFAGVLPRLGLVYWVTIMLLLVVPWRWAGLMAIGMLAIYWSAMEWVPYIGSDGTVYRGHWEFGNSLAAYIDHHLLGREHVYYSTATPFGFDPEGLLSTLPAVASCLTGVYVGRYVLIKRRHPGALIIVAVAGICLGYALSGLNPVNKALWSPTFVLITSGILTLLFWLLVHYESKRGPLPAGHPLLVAGTNSIAFFVLSGVLARLLLMVKVDGIALKAWFVQGVGTIVSSPQFASLMVAVGFTLICYLPIKVMYKKGFFWKV